MSDGVKGDFRGLGRQQQWNKCLQKKGRVEGIPAGGGGKVTTQALATE
jgi:hypothetical protein